MMKTLRIGVLASGRGSNFQVIGDAIDVGQFNDTIKFSINILYGIMANPQEYL